MTEAIHSPSAHAVALSFDPCWFDAPPERTPQFFPAFTRVSVAVQAALRRKLPECYLADIERFRDTRMIYPLLVYAASRPFPGQARTDFTYDILNPALMKRFYYSVRQNLPTILSEVSERLRAAGMDELAREYRPDRSRNIIDTVDRLKLCRRRLEALLIIETFMVNDLIVFTGSHDLPIKARVKMVKNVEKRWLSRLRRLWARKDFTGLGPELLAAATEALKLALSSQPPATPHEAPAAA